MKKRMVFLGLFAAVAIIFGYVETLLPVFVAVPGVKLGLANLVTVLMLYLYSWREASAISLVRIVVIGFMFGNLFSIVYGLAGAFVSMVVMLLMKKLPGFSMIGISLAGGVAHNLGQLVVAMLIVENLSLVYYLPALLLSGAFTGMLIGLVSNQVYRRIYPLFR